MYQRRTVQLSFDFVRISNAMISDGYTYEEDIILICIQEIMEDTKSMISMKLLEALVTKIIDEDVVSLKTMVKDLVYEESNRYKILLELCELEEHLTVVFGEISQFIDETRYPRGDPAHPDHLDVDVDHKSDSDTLDDCS